MAHHAPQCTILNRFKPGSSNSADVTIVKFQQPGQEEKIWVIRQIDNATQEFELLKLLRSAGVQVPQPLFLDASCRLAPAPYLILEFIDGMPEMKWADPVKNGRQIGLQLAKIHAVDSSQYNTSFLPGYTVNLKPDSGNPREKPIRDVLLPNWPIEHQNAPTIVHGDLWPGNVLWRDGNLVSIIDWEDANLGDRLKDLAICRFDHLFIFGREAMQAITETYIENSSANLNMLPYWDLYAALRALPVIPQWAAGWQDSGRPELNEEAIWNSHQWFVDQALAKIS